MDIRGHVYGGEGGIRTHDTLLTHTRFPGGRLQPLGHLSVFRLLHQVLRTSFEAGL